MLLIGDSHGSRDATPRLMKRGMAPLCAEPDQHAAAFFLRQPRPNVRLPLHNFDISSVRSGIEPERELGNRKAMSC